MEDMSIYDYIQENVAPNGKICPDCTMKEYIAAVYNREFEAEVFNCYTKIDWLYTNLNNSIEKVEFKIYPIVERLLDTLDSKEIEDYLKDKELDIRAVIDKTILIIEDKIENVDKKKLEKFCKKNILKTQNMHCMYIYLILASYIDLKNNEELQNIILKVGLMEEFTLFLNQFILDKFPYPEYARFYLAKRVNWQSKYIPDLLKKVSFESDEIKYWTIENYTGVNYNDGIKDIFWNLDLIKIIRNDELDLKLYLKIGETLKNILLASHLLDDINNLEKFFNEYISRYEEFSDNFESFWTASRIYISICKEERFSPEVKQRLVDGYRKVLNTDEAIKLIKEKLNDPNTNDSQKYNIYEVIAGLNISQMYLELFNSFKKNPIENASWISLFKYNREVHKEAIKILFEKIDWDNIIGEYSALVRHSFKPDPVKFLLYNVDDYPELAYMVYAKTLRSKRLEHRFITVKNLYCVMDRQNTIYELLPKELRESMQYNYDHEIDILTKDYMEFILGLDSDDDIPSKLAFNLRVVSKSDDEFIKENEKDKEEYIKHNTIYLDDHIFTKLDMYVADKGVNLWQSGKVIYFKRMKNNVTAWCQGEKFGKEYIVRLRGDRTGKLVEATCTCGKNDPKDKNNYCKHVAGTLIYLSKINDEKNKL